MNALDLLYIPVAAAYAPSLLRKKRGGWGERFGRTATLPAKTKPRVMLHAVSVGEINALRAIVPLLTPINDVVISTTTDTGLARARTLYEVNARVVRYPLDLSWSVRRFLDAVQPDVVALVELELWPNFMSACAARGIPVGVINGRLSARSFKGYRKIRFFMRRVFGALRIAAVQDEDYAERFAHMGVPRERVRVTGSMKWDTIELADAKSAGASNSKAEALATSLGIDRSRALIVAGSTGPDEEALLHAATPPGVQLLCAPRKTERFNEAAAALPGCVRRSERKAAAGDGAAAVLATGWPHAPSGADASSHAAAPTDRFLLDTIGELRDAYALADLVVVGRSFFDLFGSDPIEPIALGKPVIIGPSFGDFAQIVAAFVAAGGIRVCPREALAAMLQELLASKEARDELAKRGRMCIEQHRGASATHAAIIGELLAMRTRST
jgi:3-deoxy-D-manno-octulosonic-acid transferase